MFKLLELKLDNHGFLPDEPFIFTDLNEVENGPYTTTIVGPNGTGKSELLRLICNIFRELEINQNLFATNIDQVNYFFKKRSISHRHYIIEYYLNDNRYRITNNPKGFNDNRDQILINGKTASFMELKLPKNLIATSIMLNDKFPFYNSDPDSFYQYMGVRRSNATATTKTFIKRTINAIIENINSESYQKSISKILGFLKFENYLSIKFQLRYRKEIFKEDLTENEFQEFFINWQNRRKTNPYSSSFFKRFSENKDNLSKLIHFIKELSIKIDYSEITSLEYDLINGESIKNDYQHILSLSKLDLLTIDRITVKKNGYYDFGNASSGEFQIFASLLGVLANIKNDCLILLDEPEISLHPNWQMQYIKFIKEYFSSYQNCHFVLASHSHFIVSDLEPSTSHLIGLQGEGNGKISTVSLPKSTYGWSAENILYGIFKVRSVRNYYFEVNLREMLGLVSEKSNNIDKIQTLYNNISKYIFDDNDPLNLILSQTKEYLDNVYKKN